MLTQIKYKSSWENLELLIETAQQTLLNNYCKNEK